MIRTRLIYIEKYDVFACRQKFPTGGVGIVIFDKNGNPSGITDINRKTGKPRYRKNDEMLPDEVFAEATLATKSLPYHVLAPVTSIGAFAVCENIPDETPCLKESIIARFDEFVAKFTDPDGKFLRQQMNQNFIQFASRSKIVSSTINTVGCTVEAAVDVVLKIKAAEMARIILPANGYAEALIDMLNDLCGCNAFQELEDMLRVRINKTQKKEAV